MFLILLKRSRQENVSHFPAIHMKPQCTLWNTVSLILLIQELQQFGELTACASSQKENKDEGMMLLCMQDLAVPYQTQTQFIIFQTQFHTNNFAVSLMHLSVYLVSSTICLSCSLARHMFTVNTPPRWQMSSRANFIGINKKARARWKGMERANVIWGEERVFGGRITITTASAKKRFLFCLSH